MSIEGDPPPGGPPDQPPGGPPDRPPSSTPAAAASSSATSDDTVPPVADGPVANGPVADLPVAGGADEILPASLGDDALQDAVGARPRKRKKPIDTESVDSDGLPDEKKRNRKTMTVIALALVVGLGIAALVLLGRVNAQRYVLTCTTSQAIAGQGRAFPPWGSSPMPGAEWRPIALPANAHCKPQDVDDRGQLEALFLELLLERTSATLTTPNFLETPPAVVDGKPLATLDLVSIQLEQALLLSRSPERGDQRKQVERLQGDVQYWRASLRLRDATAALAEASRTFDQAALARPMHVSDAGAWAELLRRVTDELHAGPNGVPAGFPPAPTGDQRPGAPQGTALPVEPTPPPAAGSDAPASTPDAGVPTGGVLL